MKRDANEREIVDALRAAGHLVQHLEQGAGVPDLLVCAGGRLVLLEVKDGPKKKLTPAQVKWHAQWAGAPLFVVDSVSAALAAVADIDPQVKRVRELEEGLHQRKLQCEDLRRDMDRVGADVGASIRRARELEEETKALKECLHRLAVDMVCLFGMSVKHDAIQEARRLLGMVTT
jgi:hypothetical protein